MHHFDGGGGANAFICIFCIAFLAVSACIPPAPANEDGDGAPLPSKSLWVAVCVGGGSGDCVFVCVCASVCVCVRARPRGVRCWHPTEPGPWLLKVALTRKHKISG